MRRTDSAGHQGLGGLVNMSGCLASPAEVAAFVNQYNLTVDHWLAFKDDDAAWMERRTAGGNWQVLVPTGGYGAVHGVFGCTSQLVGGESDAWNKPISPGTVVIFSDLEVRFCFQPQARLACAMVGSLTTTRSPTSAMLRAHGSTAT